MLPGASAACVVRRLTLAAPPRSLVHNLPLTCYHLRVPALFLLRVAAWCVPWLWWCLQTDAGLPESPVQHDSPSSVHAHVFGNVSSKHPIFYYFFFFIRIAAVDAVFWGSFEWLHLKQIQRRGYGVCHTQPPLVTVCCFLLV